MKIKLSRYNVFLDDAHVEDYVLPQDFGPELADTYWEVRVETALEAALAENGYQGAIVVFDQHFVGDINDNHSKGAVAANVLLPAYLNVAVAPEPPSVPLFH